MNYKQRRNQLSRNHLAKVLHESSREKAEIRFAEEHSGWSDEQLLEYVRQQKARLGKRMSPVNTIGYFYLQTRLGPWPSLMEQINQETRNTGTDKEDAL